MTQQPKHDIHKFRAVTHLTDDNWITHKFEQEAALEECGLLDVVEGKEIEPSDTDKKRLWKDKDISAKAQIIQNLTKEVQPIVYNCKMSAEAWKALKDEYESKNLDKVANLPLQYDTQVFIEGTSMQEHLNTLKIYQERLKAMGDKISDTSHALRMLHLLPASWDGVCSILWASKPTVSAVKDRLIAEEEVRKTVLAYMNAGTAMALTSGLRDSNFRVNLEAFITTQFGSIQLTDMKNNSDLNNRIKTRPTKVKNPHLQCTNPNYKKKDHTIEKCWAKGGGQEGKGPKSKRVNTGHSNTPDRTANEVREANLADFPDLVADASAFMAKSSKMKPRDDIWIIDSGATTHITPSVPYSTHIINSQCRMKSTQPIMDRSTWSELATLRSMSSIQMVHHLFLNLRISYMPPDVLVIYYQFMDLLDKDLP